MSWRAFWDWIDSWLIPTVHGDTVIMDYTVQMPPKPSTEPPSPQIQPSTSPSKIVQWANAIKTGEGASPSSNNPGNLKLSTLTKSWGATKGRQATDGGYLCQFSTYQQGFTALCNFLTLACEGALIISHPKPCTLQQFTVRYAGTPPQGYIDRIAATLGVPVNIDIATFLA